MLVFVVKYVVSKMYIAMTVKGVFKGIWVGFKYLFLTHSWGIKRRAEQRAYEERLDEAMERVKAEKK